MKISPAPFLVGWLLLYGTFCTSAAGFVVAQSPGRIGVDGVIDGGFTSPTTVGDTLDYLKFEVLTTSTVTLRMLDYGRNQQLLAQYLGMDDEFGFIGSPYYNMVLPGHDFNGPLPSFTRTLNAGIYVVATGQDRHTSYDIFDGFVPVNRSGGGFVIGPYAYEILGDVRALEFWDGNLDGTFTVTPVPEARVAVLGAGAVLMLMGRRRR